MSGPSGTPTPRLGRIRSLFIKKESTFNTDIWGGGAPVAGDRLEAEDFSIDGLDQAFFERVAQLQSLGVMAGVVGPKGGKIKVKVPLRGCGTPGIASTQAAVGGALEAALVASMLVRMQQTGTLIDDAGAADTTTSTKVDLAATNKFGPGTNAGMPFAAISATASSGVLSVRAIPADTNGNTFTNSPPFARIAADEDTVYGADVWASPLDGSLAGAVNGHSASIILNGDHFNFRCTGCQSGPPAISGQAGQRVFLEFEFFVTDWTFTASISAPAVDAFSNIPQGILASGSPFYWLGTDDGTLAKATLPVADFNIDWGLSVKELMTTAAPNGRYGIIPTQAKPKLKAKSQFDSGWIVDFAAGTERGALLQMGSTPGACAAFYMPQAQIVKFAAPKDHGGNLGHDLELEGHIPTSGGAYGGLPPALLAIY